MFLDTLADEILFKILQRLNLSSIGSLASTSKKWHQLTQDEQLWKQRIFNELTKYPVLEPNQTYKQYYRNIYSSVYKDYLNNKDKLLVNNLLNEENDILGQYFIKACRYGAEVWAEELIQKGASVNSDDFFDHPAIEAIENGNIELFKLLLKYGLDVNYITASCLTITKSSLFHAALFSKQSETYFKILLTDANKITILPNLHQAIITRNLDNLKQLINAGEDINRKDSRGCSALWWALMCGFSDGFKQLLESGADTANAIDNGSILKVIISEKKIGYLGLVLQYNPDCDVDESWREDCQSSDDEASLLTRAIENNLVQEVKLLLQHRAIGIERGLQNAVGNNNLEIVKIIVAAGANVNHISTWFYRDHKHESINTQIPLVSAASHGYADCVKYLLEKGANPNLAIEERSNYRGGMQNDQWAITSLHKAAEHLISILFNLNVSGMDYFEKRRQATMKEFNNKDYDPLNADNKLSNDAISSIRWLLQYGANVNAQNSEGETPLIILIKGIVNQDNMLGINFNKLILVAVGILLDYKVDVNIKVAYLDNESRKNLLVPLLHYAIYINCIDLIKILCEKGNASIHSKDKFGNTALLIAAKKGNLEIIKYLVYQKANLDDKNTEGGTLLSIAEKNSYQHIVDYFKSSWLKLKK